MKNITLVLFLLVFFGCGTKTPPPVAIIETTSPTGVVSIEIPSEPTFDPASLPAGVDKKDVTAIITLSPDPSATVMEPEPPKTIVEKARGLFKPKAKPAAKNQITVMKDGTIRTSDDLKGKIQSVQTVKPSYAWVWWTALILVVALVTAYFMGKLAPAIQAIREIFKKSEC